jgi:hypothetical protein
MTGSADIRDQVERLMREVASTRHELQQLRRQQRRRLATGAGIVRAYPLGRAGGVGVVGMPGTFIRGFLGAAK